MLSGLSPAPNPYGIRLSGTFKETSRAPMDAPSKISIAPRMVAGQFGFPAGAACISTMARLMRNQSALASTSPRSSISSARRAATNSAPSPCSRIRRLAARQMSRSGIILHQKIPHPVNSGRRLRLLHIHPPVRNHPFRSARLSTRTPTGLSLIGSLGREVAGLICAGNF
jgi:hypothetical protein